MSACVQAAQFGLLMQNLVIDTMKTVLLSSSLCCSVLLWSSVCLAEAASSRPMDAELSGAMKQVFEHISKELQAGREVQVRSFGTFYAKQRAARTGRNPKTGEQLAIPAKRYPRFRSSESLKRLLNP